jgi:hypothetical protein
MAPIDALQVGTCVSEEHIPPFSTVKMEAVCYSEISVSFCRTTRCHIAEATAVGTSILTCFVSVLTRSFWRLVVPIGVEQSFKSAKILAFAQFPYKLLNRCNSSPAYEEPDCGTEWSGRNPLTSQMLAQQTKVKVKFLIDDMFAYRSLCLFMPRHTKGLLVEIR